MTEHKGMSSDELHQASQSGQQKEAHPVGGAGSFHDPIFSNPVKIPGGHHEDLLAGLYGTLDSALGAIKEDAALNTLNLENLSHNTTPFASTTAELGDISGLNIQNAEAGNFGVPVQGNVGHGSAGLNTTSGWGGGHG